MNRAEVIAVSLRMILKCKSRKLSIIPIAVMALCGCNRVPDGVIQPEPMAQLMADMRVADAVVSVNSSDYRGPATREALRMAVFNRHGVTEAQFDSSLVWYGRNIGKYQEVNDRTIDILEGRLARAGSAASAAAMSIAGDSVDIWDSSRLFTVTRRSPSQFITFHLSPDRNWEAGDVYTWRARFAIPPASASWSITAEYDDGAVEIVNSTMLASAPGSHDLTLFTDSTRSARAISGWLRIEPDRMRPAIIDSISLIRRRRYTPVNGRPSQRRIIPRPSIHADSTTTSY